MTSGGEGVSTLKAFRCQTDEDIAGRYTRAFTFSVAIMRRTISESNTIHAIFMGSIAPDIPHSVRSCLMPGRIPPQWDVYGDCRVSRVYRIRRTDTLKRCRMRWIKMKIWIMLFATAIGGRTDGKEQDKTQTNPKISSQASRS